MYVLILITHFVCAFVCNSVYTRDMKHRLNIMVSDEAKQLLDKQPNRSSYIENLILGGTTELDDRYSNKEILMQIHKMKAKLLDIEKSGVRGTTLIPVSDTVKHRDCLCPYEVNERGLNERSGTVDECPIHGDSVGFEDLL